MQEEEKKGKRIYRKAGKKRKIKENKRAEREGEECREEKEK